MLLNLIRTSYAHEAQVVHITMVLHISFYSWVGFPLQPTTYHTCGRAVWWWNRLKNQKSCLSLFREKSSYKHPIKKPRCFGKYPGWRNPSSTPPEKTSSKTAPWNMMVKRIILGGFGAEKAHLFKLEWTSLISGCFLLRPAFNHVETHSGYAPR